MKGGDYLTPQGQPHALNTGGEHLAPRRMSTGAAHSGQQHMSETRAPVCLLGVGPVAIILTASAGGDATLTNPLVELNESVLEAIESDSPDTGVGEGEAELLDEPGVEAVQDRVHEDRVVTRHPGKDNLGVHHVAAVPLTQGVGVVGED